MRERAAAEQCNHFWEDLGTYHEVGPFKGLEIDLDKCLFNLVPEMPIFSKYYTDEEEDIYSPDDIKSSWFYYSYTELGVRNLKSVKKYLKNADARMLTPE